MRLATWSYIATITTLTVLGKMLALPDGNGCWCNHLLLAIALQHCCLLSQHCHACDIAIANSLVDCFG